MGPVCSKDPVPQQLSDIGVKDPKGLTKNTNTTHNKNSTNNSHSGNPKNNTIGGWGDGVTLGVPPPQTKNPNQNGKDHNPQTSSPTSYDAGTDKLQTKNCHGTIYRVVGKQVIVMWATVEEGMLKYWVIGGSKPMVGSRPDGFIYLDSRATKTQSDNVDVMTTYGQSLVPPLPEKTMFNITVCEGGKTTPSNYHNFYLQTEQQYINWNKAINNAIKGKQHTPVFLGHGDIIKGKDVGGEKGVESLLKLEDFPRRSGGLKKKAIGKKLPGFG